MLINLKKRRNAKELNESNRTKKMMLSMLSKDDTNSNLLTIRDQKYCIAENYGDVSAKTNKKNDIKLNQLFSVTRSNVFQSTNKPIIAEKIQEGETTLQHVCGGLSNETANKTLFTQPKHTNKMFGNICGGYMRAVGKIFLLFGLLTFMFSNVDVKAQGTCPPNYDTATVPHFWGDPRCLVSFEYCCYPEYGEDDAGNPTVVSATVSIGKIWIPDMTYCSIEMITEIHYQGHIPYLVGNILEMCGVTIPECDENCCLIIPCPDVFTVKRLSVLHCTALIHSYDMFGTGPEGGYGFVDCGKGPIPCDMTMTICKVKTTHPDGRYYYCVPELNTPLTPCNGVFYTSPDGTIVNVQCYESCH